MKVICINAAPEVGDYETGLLVENEIYTVVLESPATDVYGNIEVCYCLIEIDGPYAFSKHRFIPLSEISETEFERNYNKQIV